MKTYTLFWRNGDTQLIRGDDPEQAFHRAGIGAGAMPALDFWDTGDTRRLFAWDAEKREWQTVAL